MNVLCIAEKPEVAKDIAEAILAERTRIAIGFRGKFQGDTWTVTSAFGHLMNLCEPEDYNASFKTWRIEDLPLQFPDWKIVPCKDSYKKNRLNEIGKLLKAADKVVCAGDPDDEGQLLIDEILDYFGFSGPCGRVFINDNLKANIQKEFSAIKDNAAFRNLSKAAAARRIADKCFGINESRLAGIRLQRSRLAIGRVQTPTLGLVIERDKQIEGHVKQHYFDLFAMIQSPVSDNFLPFKMTADKKYLKDHDVKHITDRDYADNIKKRAAGKGITIQTQEKDKITNPPLPYNLTTLQADMNKRFGYSMSKTLDITQTLRSKKAITYNRSDSQYLKEEHFRNAKGLFGTILDGTMPEKYKMDFARHSACFNDSLVTAHHAIIPQEENINVGGLTKDEQNVYMAIVERYIMQFLPPVKQKISESKFTIEVDGYKHTFIYRAAKTILAGFTAYSGASFGSFDRGESEELEADGTEYLPAGIFQKKVTDVKIEEKETKPPARYTEGSLAKDMASIAKYVKDPEIREILKRKDEGKKGENGSIGTVATRGTIVSGLIQRGFLERNGKSVVSTTLGRQFFEMLPPEISKPDITAKWWLIQEAIKDGEERNVNAIQDAVVNEFLKHKDSAYSGMTLAPEFVPKEKVTGIFKGQAVSFNKTWGAHTFTDEEVNALLAGEEITFLQTSKNGKPYAVTGKLEQQKYKGYSYYGFKKKEAPAKEGYITGTWKKKQVSFKGEWGGHVFTAEEAEALLNGESITFLFRTKTGEEKEVSGKLAAQTWQGRKFVGFKPEFGGKNVD